jgi:hypothetical protein
MADKRYQVFISSTFTDLKEERQKVMQAVMEMDCMPAGMELFPALDQEQLDFIKTIIDDSDYYIIILGGRYGSVNAGGIGYTEAEYDYAVSRGIRVIALIHADPAALPAARSELNEEARAKLDAFRTKLLTGRLARHWTQSQELPGLVALSLSKTIRTYPAVGWVRGDQAASAESLAKINELSIENAHLKEVARKLAASIEASNNVNLAGGSDQFIVHGTYPMGSARHAPSRNFSQSYSWDELFGMIAAQAHRPITRDYAKILIEQAIKEKSGWYGCTIKGSDFETIESQFAGLGLINAYAAPSTDKTSHVWWELTEYGLRYFRRMRSVPKGQQGNTPPAQHVEDETPDN